VYVAKVKKPVSREGAKARRGKSSRLLFLRRTPPSGLQACRPAFAALVSFMFFMRFMVRKVCSFLSFNLRAFA
jgi:hypothetical protein